MFAYSSTTISWKQPRAVSTVKHINDLNTSLSATDSRPSTSFETHISGDVLWMTGMAGFSGSLMSDDSSPIQINMSTILLQRADPATNLIGPLHASRIAFGDIRQPEPIPLIGTATGQGLLISNYPTYRPAFFNNLTFAGLLFNNWDVELYRNGEIFDYRPSSPENTYTFKDVPMLYGQNEFKLVFYGPKGETTEKNHYNVGTNMVRPGTLYYQATLTDMASQSLAEAGTAGRQPLATMHGTLGINRWLNATGSLVSTLDDRDSSTLFAGGLNDYLGMAMLDMKAACNTETERWAWQGGMQTRIHTIGLSMRMQEYAPEWSTITGGSRYLQSREFRLDNIRLPYLPAISTGYRTQRYSGG